MTATRRERVGVAVVGIFGLVLLLFPMLVVALGSLDPGEFFIFPPEDVSLRWYGEFLGSSDWRSSLQLSLTIAVLTAACSTVIGGLAGIAIARCGRTLRFALYPLLVAPLTVPTIVIGISLYTVALEARLIGSLLAFVAVNTLLTAPIVALLTVGTALGLDQRLEYASLSCGATRARTLRRVTIPLVAPSALAGGVLAFLYTLDEVVISLFLVAPGRTPLSVRMFLEVQSASPSIVTAASTLLILVSVVVIGVLTIARNLMARRGAELEFNEAMSTASNVPTSTGVSP